MDLVIDEAIARTTGNPARVQLDFFGWRISVPVEAVEAGATVVDGQRYGVYVSLVPVDKRTPPPRPNGNGNGNPNP